MFKHLSPDFCSDLGVIKRPVLLQAIEAGTNMPGDSAEFVIFQLRPDLATETQGTVRRVGQSETDIRKFEFEEAQVELSVVGNQSGVTDKGTEIGEHLPGRWLTS